LDMLDSSQEYNLFCFGIKQTFLININWCFWSYCYNCNKIQC
jgi:hypothetical protein